MEGLRERFGKYHVLERIAQGGMAEVYKVKTVGIAGFEKVQALKRILPHQAHQGRFIRSFIDEARIAVELNHRNIVQVFDFGKENGELYLAMELIEGKDLRTALNQATARQVALPVPLASYIISEVAAGLDYAHRKSDGFGRTLGIVHCDVSPSNVMLSTDGYVKILDFGIARASFASALERRRLRGKPRYMSPEQTRGDAPTPASDVFALAIIAWELYSGTSLFTGADLREILANVRRADVPRLDRVNPAVPAEVVSAVATAITVAPEGRGTAADLAGACGRAAVGTGARDMAHWLAEIERLGGPLAPWHDSEEESVSNTRPPAGPKSRGMAHVRTATSTGRRVTSGIVAPDPGDGAPIAEGTRDDVAEDIVDDPEADETTRTAGRHRWKQIAGPGTKLDAGTADTTGGAPRYAATLPGVALPQDVEPPDGAVEWEPSAQLRAVSSDDDRVPAPATSPDDAWPAFVDVEPTQADPSASAPAAPLPVLIGTGDELEVDVVDHGAAALPIDDPIDDELADPSTTVTVERRRVVVVVAAVDAPDIDLVREITHSLGELAYQRGGVVLSLGERTVVVAFGLEVAGEDDVAIAMAWSLDAGAMTRDAGVDARVRIGGRTSVPAPLDDDGRPRVGADAIDEATALSRDAQPDRPLFAGGAGRLSSSLYTLREVPSRRALGRRSRVLEVVGPRSFDERDRSLLARRGRFVGRAAALADLVDAYDRAAREDRRVTVLVTGPVGAGKSRLVAELVAILLARQPRPFLVTTSSGPASRVTPFSVVIDLYLAALGLPPARGRAARAQVVQRLLHVLTRAGVSGERARAGARDLERAMELRDGHAVDAGEVADLRDRIAVGVTELRQGLRIQGRPGLIVLEDLHQSDGASIDVLRRSLEGSADGAELVVGTARPEGPALPEVDLEIELGDLVGGELRELIVDRLGDTATPLNVAAVIARAGGNPLFVEELARAVRDARDPTRERDVELPATARDVIAARIDRLTPAARNVVRMAAVIGGAVRARLVEEVVGVPDVAVEIDELVAEGFLVRSGDPVDIESELGFVRGLVREVVYDSLSSRAQRDAHARVGRLLASRYFAGRDEPPAVIAQHLEHGGDIAGASAFWLRAGRLALRAFDAAAAAAHFTRTIELERRLGDPPPSPPARTRRREARAGREEARRLLGDLTTDADDIDHLIKLADGAPARLGDVQVRVAQRALARGDLTAALAATTGALAHAEGAGTSGMRVRGEAMRLGAEALERQARFEDALASVRGARQLFAQLGAIVDETQAMIGQGRIHIARGQFEAARDLFRPVVTRVQRLGDPLLERVVARHVAAIQLHLGAYSDAIASAHRAVDLCRRHGDRAREGDALAMVAIVTAALGRYDDAAATFRSALDLLDRTSIRGEYADCLVHAGSCDVRRGHGGIESGRAMIDEGARVAAAIGARPIEVHAAVARSFAHLCLGAWPAAEADASSAAAAAADVGLLGHQVVALARQARALIEMGRSRPADDIARRAIILLDQQRYPAGSVEEILVACADVFGRTGDDERAETLRERARQGLLRKLRDIHDPSWKASFEAIAEHRALVRS